MCITMQVHITPRIINEAISFIVFSIIDILEFLSCFVYKLIDFLVESEWRHCYCSSPKIISPTASSSKLQLDDVSITLFTRPSILSHVTLNRIRVRLGIQTSGNDTNIPRVSRHPIPRWSDCECNICTSWIHSSSHQRTLFLRVDGANGTKGTEDVLFIHGFISSSRFWTETVFPKLSSSAKSKFRFFAVDLLGFGRSPKPSDSLYTLQEHVEMIERSVMEQHKVQNLHIVAHSLGCILALALAVKHPGLIKSLTLLAPPYFGEPKEGEDATQYVMKRVGPRLVWPPIAFGASLVCWYEHISRTICLVLCKHHRLWEFLLLQLSRNRIKQYLLEGFWCHTHNASWHTLHNIMCGTAEKIDGYLDTVRDDLKCDVTLFHGQEDQLISVECSHKVQLKIPRARVNVIERKDHISIVVGREMAFARELEDIWRRSSSVA